MSVLVVMALGESLAGLSVGCRPCRCFITSSLTEILVGICPAVVAPSLSHVRLSVTPGTAAGQAALSSTISRRFLKLLSTESVMPSNHLILCRPLLLVISVFPSSGVFSNESAFCISWLDSSESILRISIVATASASVLPINIQG